MCQRIRSNRGMTLVEATIILMTVSLLASILAPSITGYIDRARMARARADVRVIGDAINDFIADNADRMFLQNASNGALDRNPPTRADANRVNLLVSDGDIPTLGAGIPTETYWTQAVNGTTVETLSNELIENNPNETAANRYRNPVDITIATPGGNNIDFARADSSGFNAPYAWRGGYLKSAVDPDPWGNRYAVNVAFLDPRLDAAPVAVANITAGFTTTDYLRLDVFVLSAGPDEEVDTRSAQDGAVPGDNDFIYVISSHAK